MKPTRINGDDLAVIIRNLEEKGEDVSQLKAIQDSLGRKASRGDNELTDEEHIRGLKEQSPVEEGEDLSCPICHRTSNKLYSGVCEECFSNWALTAKRRK